MIRERQSISGWRRRNLWVDASGDTVVRPGLRLISGTLPLAQRVHGFTVRRNADDEIFFYDVYENGGSLRVDINNRMNNRITSIVWGPDSDDVYVTRAVIGDQIVISSPGLPTLWGFVGGPLYVAKEGNSLSVDLGELPLPRGICCAWANRVVYANGPRLSFSDAGNPRAIISVNSVDPPGTAITGLHVGGRGDLFVVTTSGVYTLPPEASYGRGETVFGVFSKVTDYSPGRIGTSTVARGRVWGLTRRGVRLIDSPSGASSEILLDDPPVGITSGDRIRVPDYRYAARLYQWQHGLIVSVPSLNAACFFDDSNRVYSWWDSNISYDFKVVGAGEMDEQGDVLFLEKAHVGLLGNHDEGDTSVYGVFLGKVKTPPRASMVLREVQVASDTGGGGVLIASAAGEAKVAAPPQSGVICGTTADGSGTWLTPPLRSRYFDFASRSDEHYLEVGASGCLSRVSEMVDVSFAEGGASRRSN